MNRTRLVGLFLGTWMVVQAPLSAQQPGEVPTVPPSEDAPRETVLESTSAEGQPYWYRLPKTIRSKSPPNLIFMLHGTGVPHGWAFWNYPIASGGLRPDDIIVAPEGVTPGQGTSFNFMQGNQDGDQIVDLIQTFQKAFPIDKVYLYGHSQGAFFTYWMAGEHPELVDGIVAHAGNVLSVKHSKLAKEKVAIGILHGAADAVVPVECAYRTEKIYQEQGYQKIKLEIVEGLTEQSGHWPLPQSVAMMFDWLDQVSADSPGQCLGIALGELTKDAPDLLVLSDALRRAGPLLKKYKGDDAALLSEQHAVLKEWLQTLEASVSGELAALMENDEEDAAARAAPWVWPFLLWHPVFEGSKDWQKAFSRSISQAEKQGKAVDKAASALERKPAKKSLNGALEALIESPLAPHAGPLARQVDTLREDLPKGVTAEDLAPWDQVRQARAALRKTWTDQTNERVGQAAKELRLAHPKWFEQD